MNPLAFNTSQPENAQDYLFTQAIDAAPSAPAYRL